VQVGDDEELCLQGSYAWPRIVWGHCSESFRILRVSPEKKNAALPVEVKARKLPLTPNGLQTWMALAPTGMRFHARFEWRAVQCPRG
jgi:hypothetical protein